MRAPVIDFVPDPWVHIITDSAASARRFCNAPPDWPVKFVGFCQDRPGRIFAVLSEGLDMTTEP